MAVRFGLFAGEEGRRVGAGIQCAAGDPVALGVALPLAVVDGADDDRAVDVAVLEGDDDFLARARRQLRSATLTASTRNLTGRVIAPPPPLRVPSAVS